MIQSDFKSGGHNPDTGELFDQACVGELSVVWNRNLQNWVMSYNCDAPGGAQVLARAARKPWGPWSAPTVLFDPLQDAGFCHFIHGPGNCGPSSDKNTPNGAGGGIYAPYPIQPYTRGGAWQTTMYYLMSTWNPYDVQLMKVTLAAPNHLPFGPDTCRAGFVWREAIPDDHVCATPRARLATQQQNAEADARRAPKGGAFGLDTCLQGFVWRGAYDQDHICVTPRERSATAASNAAANSRRAAAL
jgi:Domain of unknown function (DUF4185)